MLSPSCLSSLICTRTQGSFLLHSHVRTPRLEMFGELRPGKAQISCMFSGEYTQIWWEGNHVISALIYFSRCPFSREVSVSVMMTFLSQGPSVSPAAAGTEQGPSLAGVWAACPERCLAAPAGVPRGGLRLPTCTPEQRWLLAVTIYRIPLARHHQ